VGKLCPIERPISKVIWIVCSIILLSIIPYRAYSQQEPDGEALLTFSHPSIGQYYINAVFFGDVAYLPLAEILSLTEIPYEQSENKFSFQGFYPSPKETWNLDPVSGTLLVQGNSEVLPAADFYLGELDLFLRADYFERIFGLTFTVNPYTLSMFLKATHPLPIEEKKKRENLRKNNLAKGGPQEELIMQYPRDRKVLGLGALDYAFIFSNSPGSSSLGMQMRAGAEVLGGDFQANLLGVKDGEGFATEFSGLQWRYVLPGGLKPDKNVLLSSITLGQITSSSQTSSASLLGISLTNNPIIPRQELDVFVVDGYTERDSEVELLIGGQLVDFMRADEVGYYRFNAPVTYGTVKLTLRIYTPQGEVIIQDRQLQIPFSFLPKGFVAYNIQGGRLANAPDSLASELMGHADVAIGVSNAVTVRAGLNYEEYLGFEKRNSSFGLSTRFFQQYLVNVDYLPERYYRINASVFYANNINISAQTTEYFAPTAGQEELDEKQPLRDANLNAFLPFKLFGKFSGIRLGGEKIWLADGYKANLQADYNVQFGRVAARFNYRAQLFGTSAITNLAPEFTSGLLTTALTFSLPRSPSLPVFVKGMFFRTQALLNTASGQVSSINVQLSQTFFKQGRFTFAYNRDIANKTGAIQLGFLYDFSFIRSSTQLSVGDGSYSLRQGLNGSLAVDPGTSSFLPSNRDQVSRSGISVRMFIDQNENGKFDKGEEIVPAKAVRLDKSGNMLLGSDGILRITQLQSYWTYRMEVDIQALPDPTLAPKEKVFGFVAEPNRFKAIDIPLYRTGIIDGTVLRETSGGLQGVGGLRLSLQRIGDAEPLEAIRTFSDGGYYAFGLLPGKYTLTIDPKQLEFMKVTANPGVLEFEIKALVDGDYLEKLDFKLQQIEAETQEKIE